MGQGLVTIGAPTVHAIDPVCAMQVDPRSAAGSVEYEGEKFYFCSAGCVERFRENPGRYVHREQAPPPVEAAEYTCPMHPEIVRSKPGACPICGMALEPRTATDDAANPELRSMMRR